MTKPANPAVERISTVLRAARYTADDVLDRIGVSGQAGLARNSTLPAQVSLGEADDPLANLIRLFILQQPLPKDCQLELGPLLEAGLVASDAGHVRAVVDVRPYGSPDDGASGYLVSDLTPGLDGASPRTRADYVLGASPASTTLTQMTMRPAVDRALDLGTGSGVQSLHLSKHAQQVVATDLNPRAVELARLSLELSGVAAEVREGSLFEPVAGEKFDLIVSNPPFVMSPPQDAKLTYRESSFVGDGLTRTLIQQAPDYLTDGGSMQLLTNWAVLRTGAWQDRLREWVGPTGCDAWVIERERLDRFAYIEMWLTDAGLLGTPEWEPAYRRWLAYFDQLDIDEVGMGWILLTNAGRAEPQIRIESWPHAVAQPVGEVFSRHQAALSAAHLSQAELLTSRPALHLVNQETLGAPGSADPQHIVLRQRTGLLRGMQVSTVTGAALGALDGDLTVGQVIDGVATVLEQPVDDVASDVIPVVRQALAEQYLLPEG